MAFAYEIVEQQFANIQEYADNSYREAINAIEALSELIGEEIDTTPPELSPIDTTQSFDVDPMIDTAMANVMDLVGDVAEDIPAPADAPVFIDHEMPSSPDFEWPDAPALNDIVLPDYIEESVIGLSSTLPVFTDDVPELENILNDALNESIVTPALADMELAETAHDKLVANIRDGGTMLNASVEADIWNRDLERNEQAFQDAVDKLTSQWAKLGFSLPDGHLASQITALTDDYMNKRIDRSREISVKQAELEQAGMFKSLEIATNFAGMWFGVLTEWRKRVFESTKLVADTLIELFKQRANKYNMQLEGFKTDLAAWKTAIEREMLKAEAYKARIAGLELIARIDESKVKIYIARIEAVKGLLNVWETEIKAVATMYEAEKSKTETYKAQVDAYVARIDAGSKKLVASVEGIKAVIQGWAASADAKIRLLEMKNKVDLASWDIAVKKWEIESQTKERDISIRLEALKAAAQSASNVAAGALSAAHANASASFGASTDTNYTHTYLE